MFVLVSYVFIVDTNMSAPPQRSINAEQQHGVVLCIDSTGVKIKGLMTKVN